MSQAGPVRLLVVEDELRLAESLQRGLRAEGFAVDLAHDGEVGLRLARDGGYDAVVLDVMLPRLSGYRVCQQLRAEGSTVPVLMLSAKDGEYDQADGLDLGADDYLTKPFAWVVLVARIRALLRRGGSQRPAILEVGDLVLDPAARRATRAGVELALTPREFTLLEALMRRPGDVWGGHDFDDPNVVEVYVGYLRRKIDVPFARHSLETVRGSGYRLVADDG
jgi:DNA-binding response OmpR family regulator